MAWWQSSSLAHGKLYFSPPSHRSKASGVGRGLVINEVINAKMNIKKPQRQVFLKVLWLQILCYSITYSGVTFFSKIVQFYSLSVWILKHILFQRPSYLTVHSQLPCWRLSEHTHTGGREQSLILGLLYRSPFCCNASMYVALMSMPFKFVVLNWQTWWSFAQYCCGYIDVCWGSIWILGFVFLLEFG